MKFTKSITAIRTPSALMLTGAAVFAEAPRGEKTWGGLEFGMKRQR